MQIQVASTISSNLAARVVDVCAEQCEQFATTYKRQLSFHLHEYRLSTLVAVLLSDLSCLLQTHCTFIYSYYSPVHENGRVMFCHWFFISQSL